MFYSIDKELWYPFKNDHGFVAISYRFPGDLNSWEIKAFTIKILEFNNEKI